MKKYFLLLFIHVIFILLVFLNDNYYNIIMTTMSQKREFYSILFFNVYYWSNCLKSKNKSI